MKTVRLALVAIACSVPLLAAAQWQWLDKDGRKVFSDQAPPPDVAPNRILKAPKGQVIPAAAAEAPAAPAATTAAALPRPSGKDPALEKKRQEAEAAEKAKKKAEEDKVAAAKADNCQRARTSKATLDSGVRIAQMNTKGEKEYMDDAQRAAELQRVNQMIARDCK